MAHTFTCLFTHVVFSTKDRKPLIADQCRPRLYAYLGGIARNHKARALTVGGTADHVHLLLSFSPSLCVADAVRTLKSNSSGWVHDTWPSRRDFAWQTGYGAFNVSE